MLLAVVGEAEVLAGAVAIVTVTLMQHILAHSRHTSCGSMLEILGDVQCVWLVQTANSSLVPK